VQALWEINGAFLDEAWAMAKPGRVSHAGEEEWFFDDTEIEVYGDSFEGARINYNGDRALSLQTLWRGPFVVDAILDGAGDVSEHLGALLGQHEARWKERRTHFYADSGSSAAKFLDAIREAGFSHWSVNPHADPQPADRAGDGEFSCPLHARVDSRSSLVVADLAAVHPTMDSEAPTRSTLQAGGCFLFAPVMSRWLEKVGSLSTQELCPALENWPCSRLPRTFFTCCRLPFPGIVTLQFTIFWPTRRHNQFAKDSGTGRIWDAA
jgi:hypothetical protein